MSDKEQEEGETRSAPVRILQVVTPTFIRERFALKFGLVLLIMALSIGAIGVAATLAITDQTEDRATAEFQSDANQEADIVQQWLRSNSISTQLLSANQVWDGDNEDGDLSTEVELQQTQLEEGDIRDIADLTVIDDIEVPRETFENTGPTTVASTDSSLTRDTTIDGTDRDWFDANILEITDLSVNEVYRSDTYMVDGEPVVGFVSPTAVVDRRYLLVEVSVTEIQSTLRGGEPDVDVGHTQVVKTGQHQGSGEQNLTMMDARPGAELLGTYSTDQDSLEPLTRALTLQQQESGVITEMDGDAEIIDEVYTVGYAQVEGTDWVVLTHGPRSEVFGFVDTLSTWGLIITGLSVLLIAVTGTVLGYSTSSSINRLTAKTEEMREGDLDVNLHSSRVDEIGGLYIGFADMRDSLKEQIRESERARKEAEVARAEAEEMAGYLQRKAEEYSEIMQNVAAGDLTQRMNQDGEEESMDRIAEEFNGMIEELEKTTGQLKSYVNEVEEAGSEVEQSANTVREASEQVADSIQKISDDAYDQKERLQNVSETMDEIATSLETFADSHKDTPLEESLNQIQEIAGEIQEIAELSEETMAESEHVAGAAEEQAAELNEVSERANDLQNYAQPLRDILERFETEAEHEFVFSVGPTGGDTTGDDAD